MKRLAIIVSGAPPEQQLREVSVEPGVVAADVLRGLNLAGYLLSKEGSAQFFAAEEPIYDAVNDGDKLRATPSAQVGNVLRSILRIARRLRIRPDSRPLWQARGWKQTDAQTLVGAFRTPAGSVSGEIHLQDGSPDFFIRNPPRRLLKGSHGSCFRPRGDGLYWIHFATPHRDIDAGLAAVEVLVFNALKGATA
jgi:hypothetical protein